MKKILLISACVLFPSIAFARDSISIAGSSTVLPFATIVAERFGQLGEFPTPIVESGGTGGGMKLFCSGLGDNTIDIVNASRPMKDEEIAACNEAWVADIREVLIGYDGIVFASSVNGYHFEFTTSELYLALAETVDGQPNPNKFWDDINASFPHQPIQLFIPGENHGTREVFEENVLLAGCHSLYPDLEKDACVKVRTDGVSQDIAGDYTETLARIESAPESIGVFGLSFYEQNLDKIQVAAINGVIPDAATIADGSYPVSRPLYFYVKGEHIGLIPGLEEYVHFFLSDAMTGPQGVLIDAGLIPMSDLDRNIALQLFDTGMIDMSHDSIPAESN